MKAAILAHFAAGLSPARARKVLELAISAAAAEENPLAAWRARAGAAFEKDMQPAASAIASALHAGGWLGDGKWEMENGKRVAVRALTALRRLLPGLLREVNRAPSLAVVLAQAMACSLVVDAEVPLRSAAGAEIGTIVFREDPVVTAALEQWRSREVFETDLSSAELRGFSQQLRNRSIFSARTTNADYLKEVAATVDEILAGKINMAEGRLRLMRKLKQLGYEPEIGFPQDMANIPPAERGSLQDLSSRERIDLVLETNVRMAQGFSQVIAGNGEYARYAYPAWELVRLYHRETPRGTPESKSVGWLERWSDAAESVGWVGVSRQAFDADRMIALKDSPVWQALGDGIGGYTDTLLNPFPPFAFRSGKAWTATPREECVEIGLVSDGGSGGTPHPAGETPTLPTEPRAVTATLTPGQEEVMRVVDDMPADLRAELERELGL